MNIIPYTPEHAKDFERLNKAWLNKYFEVEPIDAWVLENPDEAILSKGGSILLAVHDGEIIGAVALRPAGTNVFELTKMAVDEAFQGMGAGKLLCTAAIEEARKLGAGRVILYSNTKLPTAIIIYRKFGFKELPLEPGVYKRANIKMELVLDGHAGPDAN